MVIKNWNISANNNGRQLVVICREEKYVGSKMIAKSSVRHNRVVITILWLVETKQNEKVNNKCELRNVQQFCSCFIYKCTGQYVVCGKLIDVGAEYGPVVVGVPQHAQPQLEMKIPPSSRHAKRICDNYKFHSNTIPPLLPILSSHITHLIYFTRHK